MMMLWCDGRNNPIGSDHGLNYRLSAEVRHYPEIEETVDSEFDPGAVREEHDLTTGELQFPKYWHRWMNRFKDY